MGGNLETTLILIWIIPLLILAGMIAYIVVNRDFSIKSIIGVVLGVVLIVSVMVPVFLAITDSSQNIDTMYYDDYTQTYAVTASGALEIVTNTAGVTYAHAKDLGTGTLTYSNGTTKQFTVSKAPLDVFLFNGQSNIQYNTELADVGAASPVPKLGQAYYFGTSTQAYNPATRLTDCTIQSITDIDGNAKIGRLETPFSAEYTKLTGHKVLTINTAVGGTSISLFQPLDGEMYTRTVEGWDKALSLINPAYDVTIKGMVWCQGEADTYETVDWYKTKFLTMFDALKAMDNPIDYCYIDLIRPIRGLNSRTAQIELTQTYSDIMLATDIADTFTIANGLVGSDDVHYTQLGQNIIGVKIAQYINQMEG